MGNAATGGFAAPASSAVAPQQPSELMVETAPTSVMPPRSSVIAASAAVVGARPQMSAGAQIPAPIGPPTHRQQQHQQLQQQTPPPPQQQQQLIQHQQQHDIVQQRSQGNTHVPLKYCRASRSAPQTAFSSFYIVPCKLLVALLSLLYQNLLIL